MASLSSCSSSSSSSEPASASSSDPARVARHDYPRPHGPFPRHTATASAASVLPSIPHQLLPLSDWNSSDLDHLDSDDAEDIHHPIPIGASHVRDDRVRDDDIRDADGTPIRSLEQVLAFPHAHVDVHDRVPTLSHGRRQDQYIQGVQEASPDVDHCPLLWAPPPMRQAALRARTAKTFSDRYPDDEDEYEDNDCPSSDTASLADCDDDDDDEASDSDHDDHDRVFPKKGTPLPSAVGMVWTTGLCRRRRRRSTSATRPRDTQRQHTVSSPLHPHVHPSLSPLNLATTASPLPALASAVLGAHAPLTRNISERFAAQAEMQARQAVAVLGDTELRLASYEEMLIEALLTQAATEHRPPHVSNDAFGGLVPKEMYAYMTSRYPTTVPSNFRGSATQALKKAMRKGLLKRNLESRRYVVNPQYTGPLALGRVKPNLHLASTASRAKPVTGPATTQRMILQPTRRSTSTAMDSSTEDDDDDDVTDNDKDNNHDAHALLEEDPMEVDGKCFSAQACSPSPTVISIDSLSSSLSSISDQCIDDPRVWTPPPASPMPMSPDLNVLRRVWTPEPSISLSPVPRAPPPTCSVQSSTGVAAGGRQAPPPPLTLSRVLPTAQIAAHGLPTPPTDQDKFVMARHDSPAVNSTTSAAARPFTPPASQSAAPLTKACLSPRIFFTPTLRHELDAMCSPDLAACHIPPSPAPDGSGVIAPHWLTSPHRPSPAANGQVRRPPASPCLGKQRPQGHLPSFVVVGDSGANTARMRQSPSNPGSHSVQAQRTKRAASPSISAKVHKRVRLVLPPRAASPVLTPEPPVADAQQPCAHPVHLPPPLSLPGMPSDVLSTTRCAHALHAPPPGVATTTNTPIWLPLVPGPDGTWRVWTPAAKEDPNVGLPVHSANATNTLALAYTPRPNTTSDMSDHAPLSVAPHEACQPLDHVSGSAAVMPSELVTPTWTPSVPCRKPVPPPVAFTSTLAPPPNTGPFPQVQALMWTQPWDVLADDPRSSDPTGALFDHVRPCTASSVAGLAGRAGVLEDEGVGMDWTVGPGNGRDAAMPVSDAAALFDALVDQMTGCVGDGSAWVI